MANKNYGWTGQESAARKKELLESILSLEWQMFSRVNEGIAPQVTCQGMPKTFAIMRAAQELTWSVDVMESYLDDLVKATRAGRNLMTEKYARMMQLQGDMPARGEKALPELPSGIHARIDRIVALSLQWRENLVQRYPNLALRGRVMSYVDEADGNVSFETYLKGELATYSPRTLSLYMDMVESAKIADINLEEECLRNMVSAYGYASIEKAERSISSE